MAEVVTCPSGLSGELRGLSGKEARLLSDQKAIKSGVFLDRLFSACWIQTVNPGPYNLGADGKLDWSAVLSGDRFFITMRIRALTFGPQFEFRVKCPDCGERIDHSVDLTELPIKSLSDEDAAAFARGEPIQGHLPDGTVFTFRLPVGADETKYARLGPSAVTTFIGPMCARIHNVDGVENHRQMFEEAELSLAFSALKEMDAHDCGVETSVQVECPSCFEVSDIEIPFGKGFLAPQLTAKR